MDALSGDVVLAQPAALAHYARTWLVLDAFALVPWPLLLGANAALLKPVARAHHFRHVHREISVTSRHFQAHATATKVLYFLLLTHVCGCCWRLATQAEDADEPELRDSDPLLNREYVAALFATLSLMLGEADPAAERGPAQQLFAMALMLLGAVIAALLFGAVAVHLANSSVSALRFQEQMRMVNERMAFFHLPRELQQRVRMRYEYSWKQYRDLRSDEFLYELCPVMRRDITMHLHEDIVRSVPLFGRELPAEVVAAICELLRPQAAAPAPHTSTTPTTSATRTAPMPTAPQFFIAEDVLVREGSVGREMFFLKQGVVRLSQKSRGALGEMTSGNYFGAPRTARGPGCTRGGQSPPAPSSPAAAGEIALLASPAIWRSTDRHAAHPEPEPSPSSSSPRAPSLPTPPPHHPPWPRSRSAQHPPTCPRSAPLHPRRLPQAGAWPRR